MGSPESKKRLRRNTRFIAKYDAYYSLFSPRFPGERATNANLHRKWNTAATRRGRCILVFGRAMLLYSAGQSWAKAETRRITPARVNICHWELQKLPVASLSPDPLATPDRRDKGSWNCQHARFTILAFIFGSRSVAELRSSLRGENCKVYFR